jgi:hypothetical protein
VERLTRRHTHLLLQVPQDPGICLQILSAHDAYLTDLREALANDANAKLHDWHLSEKLADEVLAEWC